MALTILLLKLTIRNGFGALGSFGFGSGGGAFGAAGGGEFSGGKAWYADGGKPGEATPGAIPGKDGGKRRESVNL